MADVLKRMPLCGQWQALQNLATLCSHCLYLDPPPLRPRSLPEARQPCRCRRCRRSKSVAQKPSSLLFVPALRPAEPAKAAGLKGRPSRRPLGCRNSRQLRRPKVGVEPPRVRPQRLHQAVHPHLREYILFANVMRIMSVLEPLEAAACKPSSGKPVVLRSSHLQAYELFVPGTETPRNILEVCLGSAGGAVANALASTTPTPRHPPQKSAAVHS